VLRAISHHIGAFFAMAFTAVAGMLNQTLTGTPTSRRFCLCPSSIVSGQPVLLGGVLPAVALDSYQANEGGTVFSLTGSYNLPVYGETGSPPTNAPIYPGGKVYAENATQDPVTGVSYGFILTAYGGAGSVLFGYVDPQYTAGVLSGLAPDTAASVMLAGPGA
jgi:predicted RecA/RadA family phage recombinase